MFRIRPVHALLSVAHGSSSGNMFYTRTYFASRPQTSAERFEGKYVWVLVRPLAPNCPAQPRPTAPCLTGQYRCCWCCICCCRCHGCGCSCRCGRASSTTKPLATIMLCCAAGPPTFGLAIPSTPFQARLVDSLDPMRQTLHVARGLPCAGLRGWGTCYVFGPVAGQGEKRVRRAGRGVAGLTKKISSTWMV